MTKEEQITQSLAKGNNIADILNGLEIKPNMNHILVSPYKDNPYNQAEVKESGFIINEKPSYKDFRGNGEEKPFEEAVQVGKVVEIGEGTKTIKVGDDVYFYIGSAVPIPFFRQGLVVMHESRALVIISKTSDNRE